MKLKREREEMKVMCWKGVLEMLPFRLWSKGTRSKRQRGLAALSVVPESWFGVVFGWTVGSFFSHGFTSFSLLQSIKSKSLKATSICVTAFCITFHFQPLYIFDPIIIIFYLSIIYKFGPIDRLIERDQSSHCMEW